jgi:hypothetical protein
VKKIVGERVQERESSREFKRVQESSREFKRDETMQHSTHSRSLVRWKKEAREAPKQSVDTYPEFLANQITVVVLDNVLVVTARKKTQLVQIAGFLLFGGVWKHFDSN